jgi:hypothetical protein
MIQLADLPPKRSASEFEAAVDRPAKARKIGESRHFNYQAVTAIDWNSGASPLDAWLNQSAVPSVATQQLQKQHSEEGNPAAQELEEIKVFRNVHIADAPEPRTHEGLPTSPEDVAYLGLQAQIYYRNIVDRYPLLPAYLVRRLAIANYRRAERLSFRKTQANKHIDKKDDMNITHHSQDHITTMNSENDKLP